MFPATSLKEGTQMRTVILAAAAGASLVAGAARAEMTSDQISNASGLAQIIWRAPLCGYTVDPKKLEGYFVKNKLDTPEALAMINGAVQIATVKKAKATPVACTMTQATARNIGVLGE